MFIILERKYRKHAFKISPLWKYNLLKDLICCKKKKWFLLSLIYHDIIFCYLNIYILFWKFCLNCDSGHWYILEGKTLFEGGRDGFITQTLYGKAYTRPSTNLCLSAFHSFPYFSSLLVTVSSAQLCGGTPQTPPLGSVATSSLCLTSFQANPRDRVAGTLKRHSFPRGSWGT